MKPRVYLETTIPSYLTARPSGNAELAEHQRVTRLWWETERERYLLLASRLTLDECLGGDPQASALRLEALRGIPVLEASDAAAGLAAALQAALKLPTRAEADALHAAFAAVHGMEFLLTWNCRHLANAEQTAKIAVVCQAKGYRSPKILTPLELLEERHDGP